MGRIYYELSADKIDCLRNPQARDALAARLAPVDDEALVEIAARGICLERAAPACRCKDDSICRAPVENLRDHNAVWLQARAAIAAVRPHIEAAERERCAKALEITSDEIRLHAGEMSAQEMRSVLSVLTWRAAAIRRGSGK